MYSILPLPDGDGSEQEGCGCCCNPPNASVLLATAFADIGIPLLLPVLPVAGLGLLLRFGGEQVPTPESESRWPPPAPLLASVSTPKAFVYFLYEEARREEKETNNKRKNKKAIKRILFSHKIL